MEVGVRLPVPLEWLEARLFGGYYAFQPVWEGDVADNNQIEGFKGRLEFRIHDHFLIDAEVFEDDRLFGSDYLVSARVRLPFDLGAISRGENPFRAEAAPAPVYSPRLTEMVMRDPHIQIRQETGVSTQSWQETSVSSRSYPVLEGVIFVDGDNAGDPGENGSAENPFDVIQEGVDSSAASNMPNVFVHHAEQPYVENVEINSGIQLFGGAARFGNGSSPGNGLAPIVQSAGQAPFIFTFNGGTQALLRGFVFDGSNAVSGFPLIGGALFNNVPNVEVSQNHFQQLPIGVAGVYNNGLAADSFRMVVTDNAFKQTGLAIGGLLGTSGDFIVTDNRIEDALLGIGVISTGTQERSRTLISGNTIASSQPVDLLSFDAVNGLIGGFLPGSLPDTMPVPMIGGIVVGALDGKLSALVQDNQVQGALLGITGFSLNLAADRSDLDLAVINNSVQGGGLLQSLGLIMASGIPDTLPLLDTLPLVDTLPPLDLGGLELDMPFDIGLSGILTLAIGNNARINDAFIVDNLVQDHLLGITALAAAGGRSRRVTIEDNLLLNNALGITGLGLFGGNLSDLTIYNNAVIGGGSQPLMSLGGGLGLPLPEVPDISLAGITVAGYGDAVMKDILIDYNYVAGHALGINALGLDGSNLKGLTIVDNTLEENFSGVLMLGAGTDTNMSQALIAGNEISGAGASFIADLVGAFLSTPVLFPDLGLAGVVVAGINGAKINDFEVVENQIENQLIGVGIIGFGDAVMKDGIVAGNQISYAVSGIAAVSAAGSSINRLLIEQNFLYGIGIDFPSGVPIGPVTLFEDKALAGVGLLAISGDVKNTDVVNNLIFNNNIGVAAVEQAGGSTNGLFLLDNSFIDNDEDVVILP